MPQRASLPALLLAALMLSTAVAPPTRADEEPAGLRGMLAGHNAARQAVGVAPLAWSTALAAEAQQWANQLVSENCQLRYDPNDARRETTGQNLFRAYGAAPYEGYKRTAADAVARWVREGESYDHRSHRCLAGGGSECGPYLQMIWETTTTLGCAQARCPSAEVWVCHYTPRGGQEGLKPYGNVPAMSVAPAAAPPVQECGWQGPFPDAAEAFSEALQERLPPR